MKYYSQKYMPNQCAALIGMKIWSRKAALIEIHIINQLADLIIHFFLINLLGNMATCISKNFVNIIILIIYSLASFYYILIVRISNPNFKHFWSNF